MKFAYEDLSDDQFEELIVLLCQFLLGTSVQPFAKGPDGGRDAKFVGVAENHPSKASPWRGITIVQAKHTNGFNRHFLESDFFREEAAEDSTVIGRELGRIKILREAGQLDNYMFFSNRRLSGGAEEQLRTHISTRCGVPRESIFIAGVEQLELFLKTFPEVARRANLDPIDSPLIVSPDDLADLVQDLARHLAQGIAVVDDPPTPRISMAEKDALNRMTAEYAKALRRRYLKDTKQIHAFLSAPENLALMRLYEGVVDEFQLKIIAKRKDHQTFDSVLEHLAELLFGRDAILRQRQHRRLTRAMLFYMYWNCDIGESESAEAN